MAMLTPDNPHTRPDISLLRIAPEDKEARSMGKWLVVILGTVLSALAAGAVYFLLAGRGPVITVAVAEQISRGGERTVLDASGYVTPRRRATISAKITGQVTELLVDEGTRVKKGEILARLDDASIRAVIRTLASEVAASEAAVSEIRVTMKNAERNFVRNRNLLKSENVTAREVDDSKAQFDALASRLDAARKQVDVSRNRLAEMKQELVNYTVTAPFSGIVVSKDAQVGEIVAPGSAGGGYTRTGIVTVVDMESLEIEVDINESYIAKLKKGQKALATLDAYPDWRIPAAIRTIIPTADRQKATVKVRLAFESLDPKILPDMGVKVSFIERDAKPVQASDRVRIPSESLVEDGGEAAVFVYAEGRVERRPVRPGSSEGKTLEILAGLMPGEQVAVTGIGKLRDGGRVRLSK